MDLAAFTQTKIINTLPMVEAVHHTLHSSQVLSHLFQAITQPIFRSPQAEVEEQLDLITQVGHI